MTTLVSNGFGDFDNLRALKEYGASNFNECLRTIAAHSASNYGTKEALTVIRWGATNIAEAITLALEKGNSKMAKHLSYVAKKRTNRTD